MGGLISAKYSHDVYKCFADQPGHPWDDGFWAKPLYHQNMMPNLTKQRFRREHARHQIVFKSVMGKMTGGSMGAFHVMLKKLSLLFQKTLKTAFVRGPPIYRFTL